MLGDTPVSQDRVRDWAEGLDIPIGGETILFVDCEAAFYRTAVPRAVAQMLQMAGYGFGLMGEQWCCGGPAAEMGYVDQAKRFARHNVDNWRATGTKRVLVLDPHDYISFTEDYPKYFGEEFDIEVVLVIEVLAELMREGRLTPTVPVDRAITYHDPCRLNKRKGIWQEPRELLRAIPGLRFEDVDRVTQWSYCSGGGGGLPIEKPELTAKISAMRLDRAAELDIDTWSAPAPGRSGRVARPATSTVFDMDDNDPVWSLEGFGDQVAEGSTRTLPLRTSSAAGGDRAGRLHRGVPVGDAPCTDAPEGTRTILGIAAVGAADGKVVWRAALATSGPDGSDTATTKSHRRRRHHWNRRWSTRTPRACWRPSAPTTARRRRPAPPA